MAQVTYSGLSSTSAAKGALFANKKFFLVQRLPSRSRYIQDVEQNGGLVVRIESQADYVIADHAKPKDAPPGSLSYKFIEAALKNGTLPDEEEHEAGVKQGTVRIVGSSMPGKSKRTPFTLEDDKVLAHWVRDAERAGLALKGNELYKQLEVKNPRHTYQSWRDRWIKQLAHNAPTLDDDHDNDGDEEPPQADRQQVLRRPQVRTTGPTSESTAPRSRTQVQTAPSPGVSLARGAGPSRSNNSPATGKISADLPAGFSKADLKLVLPTTDDIEKIARSDYGNAWTKWAEKNDWHTAEEWCSFYEDYVRPNYVLGAKACKGRVSFGTTSTKKSEPEADSPTTARSGRPPANSHASDVIGSVRTQLPPEAARPAKRKVRASTEELVTKQHPSGGAATDDTRTPPLQSHKRARTGNSDVLEKEVPTPADQAKPSSERPVFRLHPVNRKPEVHVPSQTSSHSSSASEYDETEDEGNNDIEPDQDVPDIVEDEGHEDGQITNTSEDDRLSRTQLCREMYDQEPEPLTQENLLQMEFRHRVGSSNKAADIPVDDENQDQTDYANTLGEILQRSHCTAKQTSASKQQDTGVPNLGESQRDGTLVDAEGQKDLPPDSFDEEEGDTTTRAAHGDEASQMRGDEPLTPRALVSTGERVPESSPLLPPSRHVPINYQVKSSPPSQLQSQQEEDLTISTQVDLGDFALPEPEGGWTSILPSQTTSLPTPSQESTPKRRRGNNNRSGTETQAVFDAETQQVDDDFPSPPGEDENDVTTHDQVPAQSENEAVDPETWFAEKIDEGHSKDHTVRALQACSMKLDLAEIALDFLVRGRGLPPTIAGIWTEEEDRALQESNPRRLKAIEKKHGKEEFDARLRWLDDYRD